MKIKTIQSHLECLKKATIEKNEINAISKFLNSLRFGDPTNSTKDFGEFILSLINEKKVGNKEGYKLTKEQTEFGIQWLKDRYFKKDGSPRKQAGYDFHFMTEESLDIIKNFKEFRFVGYTGTWDSYSKLYTYFVPIYRVYSKDGKYFDYSPVYMGNPIINPECIENIF